jgi:hypothetical protein
MEKRLLLWRLACTNPSVSPTIKDFRRALTFTTYPGSTHYFCGVGFDALYLTDEGRWCCAEYFTVNIRRSWRLKRDCTYHDGCHVAWQLGLISVSYSADECDECGPRE